MDQLYPKNSESRWIKLLLKKMDLRKHFPQ